MKMLVFGQGFCTITACLPTQASINTQYVLKYSSQTNNVGYPSQPQTGVNTGHICLSSLNICTVHTVQQIHVWPLVVREWTAKWKQFACISCSQVNSRLTWKCRIMVHINPNVSFGFPSVMSSFLMFTSFTWGHEEWTNIIIQCSTTSFHEDMKHMTEYIMTFLFIYFRSMHVYTQRHIQNHMQFKCK